MRKPSLQHVALLTLFAATSSIQAATSSSSLTSVPRPTAAPTTTIAATPYTTTICSPCTAEVCIAVCNLITTVVTPTPSPTPVIVSTTILNTTYPCSNGQSTCISNFTGSWTATPVIVSVEVLNTACPTSSGACNCVRAEGCPCSFCPPTITTVYSDTPLPQWAVQTITSRPTTTTSCPSSASCPQPTPTTFTTIIPYYSFVGNGLPTTTYVLPCGATASCASNAECIYPLCASSTTSTSRSLSTAALLANSTETTADAAALRRSIMWNDI